MLRGASTRDIVVRERAPDFGREHILKDNASSTSSYNIVGTVQSLPVSYHTMGELQSSPKNNRNMLPRALNNINNQFSAKIATFLLVKWSALLQHGEPCCMVI